ncbi:MAG TPA: hypothetical protein VK784_09575 [Pseudonocardiaceae bacterium]|nr:hypothetical protein [Pseudonocardiaceae bacterium]
MLAIAVRYVTVQLSLPSHRVSPAVAADGHEAAVHPELTTARPCPMLSYVHT